MPSYMYLPWWFSMCFRWCPKMPWLRSWKLRTINSVINSSPVCLFCHFISHWCHHRSCIILPFLSFTTCGLHPHLSVFGQYILWTANAPFQSLQNLRVSWTLVWPETSRDYSSTASEERLSLQWSHRLQQLLRASLWSMDCFAERTLLASPK